MNTNKQFIVIIVLTLTVIGVILFVYFKRKNAAEKGTDSQITTGAGTSTSTISSASALNEYVSSTVSSGNTQAITNTSYPLRYAPSVYSSLVKEAQGTLNKVLIKSAANGNKLPVYNGSTLNSLVEDGYYGPRMAAVVAWISAGTTDGHMLGQNAMSLLRIYAY